MLAYRAFDPKVAPELVEVPLPQVGDDDVLVQIFSAGITYGTLTLHNLGLLKPLPMTLGHEGAGIVTAVGRAVRKVKPGMRVRVHPTLSCGHCGYCLNDADQLCHHAALMGFASYQDPVPEYKRYHNGFLAEFSVAPERQIDVLPDSVAFDAAAKIHYAANAVRALRLANIPRGGTLAILGATGAMGVVTIRASALFGVGRLVLIGRSAQQLENVRSLSPLQTSILSTDQLETGWENDGTLGKKLAEIAPDGVAGIIDYLPRGGPLWRTLDSLVPGGSFVTMGGAPESLDYSMQAVIRKSWKIVGTRNHSRSDAREVLRAMERGLLVLDDLVTHHAPLSEVESVMQATRSRVGTTWLSVVHPHAPEQPIDG